VVSSAPYLGLVASSLDIGFDEELRGATSGQALPHAVFDHRKAMQGDPREESGRLPELIKAVRKRKGLDVSIPSPDRHLDRLRAAAVTRRANGAPLFSLSARISAFAAAGWASIPLRDVVQGGPRIPSDVTSLSSQRPQQCHVGR